MGRQNRLSTKTKDKRVSVEFKLTEIEAKIINRLLLEADLGELEAIGLDPADLELSGASINEAYEEMAYLFAHIRHVNEKER